MQEAWNLHFSTLGFMASIAEDDSDSAEWEVHIFVLYPPKNMRNKIKIGLLMILCCFV